MKIVGFKKGTILLKEGQNSFDNYFVVSGCVRQYILKDGDERVTKFYTEEEWILPAVGIIQSQRPCACMAPLHLFMEVNIQI